MSHSVWGLLILSFLLAGIVALPHSAQVRRLVALSQCRRYCEPQDGSRDQLPCAAFSEKRLCGPVSDGFTSLVTGISGVPHDVT